MLDGVERLSRVQGERMAREDRERRLQIERHGERALRIVQSGIIGDNDYRLGVEVPFSGSPDSFIPTPYDGVLSLFKQSVWPDTKKNEKNATGLIVIIQSPGNDAELRQAIRRNALGGQTRAVLINFGDLSLDLGQAVRLDYRIGRPLSSSSPFPNRVIAKGPAIFSGMSPKLVDILLDRIERSQPYQKLLSAQHRPTS